MNAESAVAAREDAQKRALPRATLGSLAAIVAFKVALAGLVLARGFTHVSDDDYSRTVIAERFAHVPRLDPSGTSWSPFLSGSTARR